MEKKNKEKENILLIAPLGYRKIGGLYITIDGYLDNLSLFYNIELLEVPYHENKIWKEQIEKITNIIKTQKIRAILVFGLNASWMITKKLKKVDKKRVIALIRDSNYYTILSGLQFESRISVDNAKNMLRLIPYKTKEEYCAKNCFSLVYASRWDANCVKRGYKNVNARIVVQENGVYIPESIYVKDHDFNRNIVFGFMGSWTSFYVEHCIMPFIDICENYLIKEYPQILIKLAGRGITNKHRNMLRKYKYVHFMGEVDKLEDFFEQVDLVFSTVKKRSGILNKILEAFAYGKCVIGYTCNFFAIRGSVDGVNCIHADSGGEFKDKLKMIVGGYIDIDEVGMNARNMIKDTYTWRQKAEIVRKEIERINI